MLDHTHEYNESIFRCYVCDHLFEADDMTVLMTLEKCVRTPKKNIYGVMFEECDEIGTNTDDDYAIFKLRRYHIVCFQNCCDPSFAINEPLKK